METKTIASTPIRPAKKSRIMEMSRPTTTGAVPAAQIQFAGSARPKAHVSRPRTSPPRATTIRARRYNGDIGYIDDVDPNAGEVVASFDGRSVTYGFGELDMLVPAYAATIHKSQGSEYPAVVIPVMTQHYAMLQRNLLYTGVTRGKRLVVLVGQKKAVAGISAADCSALGRRRTPVLCLVAVGLR